MRILALIGALLISGSASAQVKRAAPAEAQVIAGAYEVSNEAGTRKCVILLRPSDTPGGYAAGLPAQCRVALPVLGKVSAWTVETLQQAPRARIILLDANGAPQADFKDDGPQGASLARDRTGQVFILRPTQGASLAARVDSLVGARPAPRAVFSPPPPDPAAMSRATGIYALFRPGEKDTGCRIRLIGATPSATDGATEVIQRCADKGLAFFGPKGWNIAAGTLWLIGARGRISFEPNRKGGWDKTAGQGEGLSLNKQ